MKNKTLYWLELCDDDLITAKALLDSSRFLHMGFFCHMIIEKSLKAVITENTGEIPPKIHDLQKLAKMGNVSNELSDEQSELLDKVMPLQIEARYPEYKEKISQKLNKEYCDRLIKETEDFLCWIKQWLEK
ncbi:MAG: HEPN domain-containing protein [Oscillospiraceae bacterium]|nr:HEPN domain-containing protein [Oscillospiraceae bacterium]